ncbi:MAG: carboxymuconolactone decarboxylase family protein [Planctomycetes bacterium]|nr:carboxymuconolactone decarboxylase family protein [Planctomycetota bacterium]
MSWIRLVGLDEASGKLAELYRAATLRAGKVFHIVRAMSPSPHVLEASMGVYRAILFGPSELSRAEREFLAVVTSRSNRCHY